MNRYGEIVELLWQMDTCQMPPEEESEYAAAQLLHAAYSITHTVLGLAFTGGVVRMDDVWGSAVATVEAELRDADEEDRGQWVYELESDLGDAITDVGLRFDRWDGTGTLTLTAPISWQSVTVRWNLTGLDGWRLALETGTIDGVNVVDRFDGWADDGAACYSIVSDGFQHAIWVHEEGNAPIPLDGNVVVATLTEYAALARLDIQVKGEAR